MTGVIVLILRFLLVIALYAFLGWALFTLWRELRATSQIISARQIPALLVTSLDTLEENTREFRQAEVVFGRDPACDLVVSQETVSSHHARLSYHHNQWWVEDLTSTNGTMLNDEPVFTPTVVISGDELHLGRVGFRLTIRND